MILINSIKADPTTNDVIDWIKYKALRTEVLRLNPENKINDIEITLKSESNNPNIKFFLNWNSNPLIIDLDLIASFWYRRGELNFNFNFNFNSTLHQYESDIINYLFKEWSVVSEFISEKLLCRTKIGNVKDNRLNKLEVLFKACILGIKIPNTSILTKGKKDFKGITKSIYNSGFSIDNKKYSIGAFTEQVHHSNPKKFFPSLFQEEILKLYELRIFYLANKFYASAIFSQKNPKTEVDFRNYDREKPNRVVPYQLPKEIQSKLQMLMDELRLETSSIDMIVTPTNEYVFLEVNPIGQFSQVSVPCNYYLEEKIADYLLN